MEEVVKLITESLASSENHSADFSVYTLIQVELQGMGEEDQCSIGKGSKVYEAAYRITMGCDMAYALEPQGYFVKKPDNVEDYSMEWIERVVE